MRKDVASLLPYLPAFVAVAEERSFKKAALRLGVTTAAVSKAVQRLEGELGVRLLERTTRHVAPTRAGIEVLARLQAALRELEAARAVVDRDRDEPVGEVVVHVSPVLSQPVMAAMARLCARHLRVVPRVVCSDRISRLAEDDVDVAVRLGGVGDDRLVARALGEARFVTLGAPGYLARRGRPRSPADLVDHDIVGFVGPRGAPRPWTFVVDGLTVTPAVTPRATVDHGPALVAAALAGLGLVQVFPFMAEAALKDGALLRVLDDVEHERRTIHAVTTTTKVKSRVVKSCLTALVDVFREWTARNGAGG